MTNREPILLVPSFYAHTLNGFFLLVALFLAVIYFSKIIRMDPYRGVTLILLLSIAIGVHGISHIGMESVYGYTPMKWITRNM